MTTETLPDLIAAILLVLGGILTLAAGVGLVRFPDAPSRLHASTKPQVLGLVRCSLRWHCHRAAGQCC